MPLNLTSTTEEKIKITLNITTASGNPAQVDGPPTWEVTDGSATIVPEADGLSAYLISGNEPGVANWKVTADADLGAGVQEIVDGGTYTYNHPQAAALGLTAGTPEPK
jgi:hypothetical protein